MIAELVLAATIAAAEPAAPAATSGAPACDLDAMRNERVEDGGARKDETWSARASVYNRGLTLMGFSPEVGVVHEVRNTNAQLYDYERTSGELRFVRQF